MQKTVQTEKALDGILQTRTSAAILDHHSEGKKAAREKDHGARQRDKGHQKTLGIEMKKRGVALLTGKSYG